MATTLYLWSNSQESSPQDLNNKTQDPSGTSSEPGKPKMRKNNKSNSGSLSQKKQPQRGLGVAQLERLRIQEQRQKIKEVNRQVQSAHFQYALPSVDQQNAARFGYGGGLNEGQASLQCLLQRYRLSSGGVPLFSDQSCVDRNFRTAVNDGRFQNHMRELSSSQSVRQCLSDQCVDCVKRKRMQGESLRFNGLTTTLGEISKSKEGNDFLELALWNNSNSNKKSVVEDEMNPARSDRKMEMIKSPVGVGARKGKSVAAETQLMEYDFFPPRGDSNNSSSGSARERGGSSSPSHPVDLSLKLSSF